MQEFSCGVHIVSGHGAAAQLQHLHSKRLLLVTDPYFSKSGDAARIAAMACAEQTEIFDRVQPDPSVELAAQGTALVQRFQPDTIVALGGGSAMDCAKAMAFFCGYEPYLVAIPTTSGSGSEVTDFAIITHQGIKHPLVDPKLRPKLAILDSSLLQKMPPALVADAGFDLIHHALESYVATGASAITDALAAHAFRTALQQLPASFAGDTGVRGELHMAATMAGIAFNQAGLGLGHALAHALGGAFHIPHGRLGAILLPALLDCNAPKAGEKYARLARLAGLPGSARMVALRNLKNALVQLRSRLGLPATLAQAGIDPAAVHRQTPALITAVLEDPCCRTNPVPVDAQLVRQLLEAVTGHG